MNLYRLKHTACISLLKNGFSRAEYLKKKKIFAEQGEGCFWQPRYIPAESKLIKLGNHVVVASEVLFINHDAVHHVLRGISENGYFPIRLGAIEIGDHVFIGSRSMILPDIRIGSRVIIGAGSVVTKDVPDNCIVAGVPARKTGETESLLVKRRSSEENTLPRHKKFPGVWETFYALRNGAKEDKTSGDAPASN